MEDHRKHRTQSTHHNDEKFVELTKDMELSDQNEGDIIDLTKSVDDTGGTRSDTVPESPALATELRTSEPDQGASSQEAAPSSIEEEVDVAFEAAQAGTPKEIAKDVPDEQLFDKLSDITERVDNAIREQEPPPAEAVEETQPPEPSIPDDDAIAADAAVFEAAMQEEYKDEDAEEQPEPTDPEPMQAASDLKENEEIIELSDIVDPTELAPSAVTGSLDDTLPESSDMHDPAPDQLGTDMEEDEEIIELTDIIDPAEYAQLTMAESMNNEPITASMDEDEEIIELTDIVDPAIFEQSTVADPLEEELPELTGLDDIGGSEPDFVSDEVPASPAPEDQEHAIAETAEIADMFMEEMAPEPPVMEEDDRPTLEQVVGAPLAGMDDEAEEQEQVIQFSDVRGQADEEERIPIEKIKMGAEEDLDAQPVSLEREDTANALGLNLEMQQKVEAAVQHLLETKFADTIKQLIADAVEKAVASQIKTIKRSMQDEDDTDA